MLPKTDLYSLKNLTIKLVEVQTWCNEQNPKPIFCELPEDLFKVKSFTETSSTASPSPSGTVDNGGTSTTTT